jgi:hypothetical protein
MLMNNFKMHIKNTYPGMMHFLTYADNYAVGYFKKQVRSHDMTAFSHDSICIAGFFERNNFGPSNLGRVH